MEPDNLDSWTRAGVRGAITRADNLAVATLLVRRGHAHGLAVAQKNTAEVIEIEYTDNPIAAYTRACAARHGKISTILRDRDVVPPGSAGYRYAHC